MKKAENIVYRYYDTEDTVYINLTNRCSNACEFCIRNGRDAVRESDVLWLEHEPSAKEVIDAIREDAGFSRAAEFVFCGFGEPTYRIDEVEAVGKFLRQSGKRTRINTNGQGSLIQGRDIVPQLMGSVDIVSISLNASTPERYQQICHCRYGEEGYTAMLDFAGRCREAGLHTVLSVVDTIGEEEIACCQRLADQLGIPLRVRQFE